MPKVDKIVARAPNVQSCCTLSAKRARDWLKLHSATSSTSYNCVLPRSHVTVDVVYCRRMGTSCKKCKIKADPNNGCIANVNVPSIQFRRHSVATGCHPDWHRNRPPLSQPHIGRGNATRIASGAPIGTSGHAVSFRAECAGAGPQRSRRRGAGVRLAPGSPPLWSPLMSLREPLQCCVCGTMSGTTNS